MTIVSRAVQETFIYRYMEVKIEQSWKEQLQGEFEKEYFAQLVGFVKQEYRQTTVYPPGPYIFNAFERCPFDKVKVVILGQDPYHEPGQAHGLCFSVQDGTPFPPSLVNIFKEIESDLGKPVPKSGNLNRWAEQGVLLLNATLTVRAHQAGSHQNKGWETFTDAVIQKLNERNQPMVFLLWGANAKAKQNLLNNPNHLVLTAPHPSPFAANSGFFGCHHFSKATRFLNQHGITMDWKIPD